MNLSLKVISVVTMALIFSGCTVYQQAPNAHKAYRKNVKVVTPVLLTEHNAPNIIIVKTKPKKRACTKHKDHWHCKAN
jgi:PBP1b-binding outer membrane lipoprotein LpoB